MRTLAVLVTFLSFSAVSIAGATVQASKRFIYVNNGYTASMNHEVHDLYLQSFDHDLFNGNTVILNAGGPDATVVLTTPHGVPLLNPDGSFRMAPSAYQGRPSATLQNFRKEIRAAAQDNVESLTLVFGGHGGPSGFPFWGGEYISGKNLNAIYRDIPATTLIRTIQLNCYAGRALVDSKRTVAQDLEHWGEYLDRHYPANRCALGVGNADELGEYIGQGEKWPDTEWSRIFRALPRPSLRDLQRRLTELRTVSPLPKLTSDYLVDDVLSRLCRLKEPRSPGQRLPGEAAICADSAVQAFARAEQATYTADDLYLEYRLFKQTWARDQIWEKDIELYISYGYTTARVENIQAAYANRVLTDAETAEMEARIRAEWGDKQERWNRMFSEFSSGMHPDYRRYLENCDFGCIQAKASDLPVMNAHPELVFPAGKVNLLDLELRLFNHLRNTQKARKLLAEPMRARLSRFIETELVKFDPRWERVISRYKQLRSCEAGAVN